MIIDGTPFVESAFYNLDPEPDTDVEPVNSHSSPENQSGFGILSTLRALGGLSHLVKRRVTDDKK